MANIIWTPWRSHDELLAVRSQLYAANGGEEQDMRANACSLINAWRLRRKLPHAVESTWLLTESMLADEGTGFQNVNSVRACYSTTFCRFVTGLLDTEQDGAFKSSMYETAKQIGLPASFIDIRHDAIHGNLPSLTVLREVTRKALDWLWNDYWKHLDGNLRANEQDGRPTWDDQMEASKEQVRRILHGYRLAAPTTASSNNPKDSGITPETTNTCLRLVKVCKCEQPALSDLVSMLVKGDLIIPRSRLLGDSMDDTFSLWEPLLKQLTYHQKPFLNLLTQMLINQIISPSLTEPEVDVHREAVHFWLLQIYTSQEWSSARKRGKINADDLLSICLQNPNFWTNPIACAIVNEPGGSRLGTIYEDRIDAPAMVTAQAAPHDSPTPKIPEGNLADLLAYQEVWLQAVEDSQKENIDPNIPTLPVGGWQKWVGEWTPKPFGTV